MVYFCPDCRQVIRGQYTKCPTCRRDLLTYSAVYERKLIADLDHFVKGARLLALEMLGKLKSRKAIPRLKSIIGSESDPHVLKECVKALSLIDASECRAALRKTRRHSSMPTSKLAGQLLRKI